MTTTIIQNRNQLGTLLKHGAICAEIGVHIGGYSLEILKWPVGHLYAIDSWCPQPGYNDPLTDADHEKNYQDTLHNLRGHMPGGRVTVIRADSLSIAKNASWMAPLDFAFIDADHGYEGCLADLRAWSKRMKRTGLLCGHDYTDNETAKKFNWGVIRAVSDFCAETDWRLTHLTNEDFASFVLQRI